MRKVAILNNKGGVGKSTISVNLAHGLAKMGFKVLLIDLDGQNDSSLFLGCEVREDQKTFYDILDRRYPSKVSDCIIQARDNLDLLPNKNIEEINADFHREARIDLVLNEKLNDLESLGYDFVVVDCGPQRTKVNDAVLCYVDKVIMPVQLEAASVRAVGNIYEYLADLHLDTDKIAAVIPNMYDQRTKDAKENLALLQDFFSDMDVVTEPIYRRVRITEGSKLGKTVFEHDEESALQILKVLEKVVIKIA